MTLAGWTRGVVCALLLATGCAEGAKLVQVTDSGGVVTYPLKRDRESIYASPFRGDALTLIDQQCGGRYTIVREGETKGRSYASGREGGDDEIATQRFWGLQFRCK